MTFRCSYGALNLGQILRPPTTIEAAQHVATRNILNPLLWLCGIVSAPALVAASFASGLMLAVYLLVGLIPPAFTLVMYLYWTFKNPDRLQSEDFVLQQRMIDVAQPQIVDNRTNETIELTPKQVALTANTATSSSSIDA